MINGEEIMKLYFENSYKERRLIGEPQTHEESSQIYQKFCADRNFKIYYVRHWTTPNGERYYDVGSHTEFFVEVDDNEDN
jgi:hypothetical protein